MAIGRSVFAAPIGSGLVAFSPAPAYVRTDNTTPFIQINTEGDIEELRAALVRQPVGARGAAHIDLHEGLYEGATIEHEDPDIQAPTETYPTINFFAPSEESLTPPQLLSTLESIFTTLETGEITNTIVRDEGLCLLEGYYTPFSTSTLQALYPTHTDYVTAFTAAAASDLASGFLTQPDYNTAVAAAQVSSVP